MTDRVASASLHVSQLLVSEQDDGRWLAFRQEHFLYTKGCEFSSPSTATTSTGLVADADCMQLSLLMTIKYFLYCYQAMQQTEHDTILKCFWIYFFTIVFLKQSAETNLKKTLKKVNN